jgi:uncharacterized caspase-like protein
MKYYLLFIVLLALLLVVEPKGLKSHVDARDQMGIMDASSLDHAVSSRVNALIANVNSNSSRTACIANGPASEGAAQCLRDVQREVNAVVASVKQQSEGATASPAALCYLCSTYICCCWYYCYYCAWYYC